MTSNLKIRALVQEAYHYVFQNKAYYWAYLKPLLPYIIILDFFTSVGKNYSDWFNVLLIFSAYFSFLFALSCFRAGVKGASYNHVINPFKLNIEDKRFLWLNIKLGLLIGVLLIILIYVLATIFILIVSRFTTLNSYFFVILTMTAFLIIPGFYGLIFLYRLSFLLPAWAVGKNISWKTAIQLSEGFLNKLFWATSLVMFIFSIPFLLLMLTPFLREYIFNEIKDISQLNSVFFHTKFFIIYELPHIFINQLVIALCVFILCRLYQYSVEQNNL